MANALDRVRAAEAKYAAMAGTTEKLEATLKKLKGTVEHCLATINGLEKGHQSSGPRRTRSTSGGCARS